MKTGQFARHAAAAVLPLLILCGCGYQMAGSMPGEGGGGGARSLYRQDIRTVAAPIFTNKTFRRGWEFNLSKAVVTQLEAHTPYKVVPAERADTILEGEIISVDVDTISNAQSGGIPQEQLLTIVVNFTWKDLRTGRTLAERRGFEQSAPYYPTLGEGQFTGAQQNVERLALAIVQELQADW